MSQLLNSPNDRVNYFSRDYYYSFDYIRDKVRKSEYMCSDKSVDKLNESCCPFTYTNKYLKYKNGYTGEKNDCFCDKKPYAREAHERNYTL